MESVIIEIAVQVPALALVIFFSLQAMKMILDVQGRKLDRVIDVIERHNQTMVDLGIVKGKRSKSTS